MHDKGLILTQMMQRFLGKPIKNKPPSMFFSPTHSRKSIKSYNNNNNKTPCTYLEKKVKQVHFKAKILVGLE